MHQPMEICHNHVESESEDEGPDRVHVPIDRPRIRFPCQGTDVHRALKFAERRLIRTHLARRCLAIALT